MDEKLTISIAPPAQENAEKPEIVVDDSAVIVSSPAHVTTPPPTAVNNDTSEPNKLAVPVESESESEPEPEPVDRKLLLKLASKKISLTLLYIQ